VVFSVNLLKAREAAGLTQRELSDLSGVSQKHISQIELAGSNVTLDTLAELARHLKTTPAKLLTPPRTSRR
jgi:transcriptional regulator with XRE-family HTH domain